MCPHACPAHQAPHFSPTSPGTPRTSCMSPCPWHTWTSWTQCRGVPWSPWRGQPRSSVRGLSGGVSQDPWGNAWMMSACSPAVRARPPSRTLPPLRCRMPALLSGRSRLQPRCQRGHHLGPHRPPALSAGHLGIPPSGGGCARLFGRGSTQAVTALHVGF